MIRQYDVFEEIVKEVMPFGNGSIVYTPKKWVGQTVRVILEGKPLNIKKDALEALQPFLEHVKGIFLHGSFARNEQTPDSDIDVLVVAGRKFKPEKKDKFDFTVIEESILRKELQGKDPFYIYFVLQEAKPILNRALLEELKQIKIDERNFKWLLEEAESALRISEEFLGLDKLQKRKSLDSTTVVYSLMLRLRSFFLLHCLLHEGKYSNAGFRAFLQSRGLQKELVEDFYAIYRAERNERKNTVRVSLKSAEMLYLVAKKELEQMNRVYKRWHQKRRRARQ